MPWCAPKAGQDGANNPSPELLHTQGRGVSSRALHLCTGHRGLSVLPMASNVTTACTIRSTAKSPTWRAASVH